MTNKSLHWVILAGGRATRMGGEDKGLITLNGRPLIEIVYNSLAKQVTSIAINANRNQEKYGRYASVHGDDLQGFLGPLAGIHASIRSSQSDWVGFTPCDTPDLPDDLVERLTANLKPDVDVYVAHDGRYAQPVFSVWNRKSLAKLETFLQAGDRKMKLLLDICNTEYVDFSHRPETFTNLNTPEELSHFGTHNDNT